MAVEPRDASLGGRVAVVTGAG
ncbi:MAG: hypothetical protein QOC67_1281, partial [Pseudonocardiales bacterium]|nr:hypothetical protein [Pseudonocardiales bacterium]